MDIHELCRALDVKPQKNGYLSRADLRKFRGKMGKGVSSSGRATDTWNVLTELQRAGLVKSFKHGAAGYLHYGCRCLICTEGQRKKVMRFRSKHPNYTTELVRRFRKSHREAGLCIDCMAPAETGSSMCATHAIYNTEKKREQRSLHYEKWK